MPLAIFGSTGDPALGFVFTTGAVPLIGGMSDVRVTATGFGSPFTTTGNGSPFTTSGFTTTGFPAAPLVDEVFEFPSPFSTILAPDPATVVTRVVPAPAGQALIGTPGSDDLAGGADDDAIDGREGRDALFGGGGDDTLFGNLDEDLLRGGRGDDVLFGGPGDDTVWGDRGHDLVTGGGGADIFAFAAGSGRDRILDFDPREGDRLLFTAGMAFTIATDLAGDTVIVFSATDDVTLTGVRPFELGPDLLLGA